jgi:mono/diheme cytochrome c family protein
MMSWPKYLLTLTLVTLGVVAALVAVLGLRVEDAEALGLPFLGAKSDRPPVHFIDDMKYQPKYRPQGESAFFPDGRAQRLPVVGTVPFGGADYYSDAGSPLRSERPPLENDFLREDDRIFRGRAGPDTTDPKTGQPVPSFVKTIPPEVVKSFAGYPRMLERGRERYTINCAPCHGAAGYGNGITTQYGMNAVANYHDPRLREGTYPDGELFHVITNGKNSMAGYGPQVNPRDRWAIVAYVRALQLSQNTPAADVPASVRAGGPK